MKVTGIQFDLAWEAPAANFVRARTLVREAAAEGTELVVLPEMFATGFTMDTAAAATAGVESQGFMAGLAKELDIWVLGGWVDASAGLPLNAASLYCPDGEEELRYHKIHTFSLAGEHHHYASGIRMQSARINGLRITPVICYDLRFPEIFRHSAPRTDLFVVLANWPEARRDAWRLLLRARAVENQCYVLGVNRVGRSPDQNHMGDSALIDPLGRELNAASKHDALISGDVSAARVERVRRHFPFLSDRRPELYAQLAEAGETV